MHFVNVLILIIQKGKKHSALIDCHLLKEVYVNLLDQKEPQLNLESVKIIDSNFNDIINNKPRKIIKPDNNELELHKKIS